MKVFANKPDCFKSVLTFWLPRRLNGTVLLCMRYHIWYGWSKKGLSWFFCLKLHGNSPGETPPTSWLCCIPVPRLAPYAVGSSPDLSTVMSGYGPFRYQTKRVREENCNYVCTHTCTLRYYYVSRRWPGLEDIFDYYCKQTGI